MLNQSLRVARPLLRRHARWAVPLSAGIALYALPSSQPRAIPPTVFSSPTIIPCRTLSPTIFSPSEAHRSLSATLRALLREHIWEPILTAKRFIYLLFLFAPVIVTSPMLLIGKPQKSLRGDKWGAVWWYGLLVSRMEAAGPTFIKVVATASFFDIQLTSYLSYPNGPPLALIFFHFCFVNAWARSIRVESLILLPTQNPS